MTATAAVIPAAAPRATPTSEPRDAVAEPGKFDRQLDAARQKQASPPADGGNKTAAGDRPARDASDPSTQAKASPTTPVKADGDGSSTAKDTDDDAPVDGETPAGALASAMLALLGPANVVLRPLATGIAAAHAGPIGKTAAADASAAALLKMNAAAGSAANAATNAAANVTALPAGAGIMLAAGESRLASVVDKAADAPTQPAAALALPSTSTHAAPSVHQLQIPTPAGSHGFAQELGQQVAWLGGQDVKQARIRLHPEELGQLDIKVSVHHGRVDVVFNAQHPGAVAAVQQSLPQLDQMLGQHGLSLGHAEVGQHDHGGRGGGERHAAEDTAADEIGEIHAVAATTGAVGLLDAFA
jgi:flagellar hook-length control protein FliK